MISKNSHIETCEQKNNSFEKEVEYLLKTNSIKEDVVGVYYKKLKSLIETHDNKVEALFRLKDFFIKSYHDYIFQFNRDEESEILISNINKVLHAVNGTIFSTFYREKPFNTLSLLSDLREAGYFEKHILMDAEFAYYADTIDFNNERFLSNFEKKTISEQINTILMLFDLSAEYLGSDNSPISQNIVSLLEIVHKKSNSPLVRIFAYYYFSHITEIDRLSSLNLEQRFLDLSDEEEDAFIKRNQKIDDLIDSLYGQPNIPSEKLFDEKYEHVKGVKKYTLSKDYSSFGYDDSSSIGLIEGSDNTYTSIEYKTILSGVDVDTIKTFHNPRIFELINKNLNIHLENMYLTEQAQFLEYLSGTKTENWEQLEHVLKNKNLQNENILRSFLSLDKGGPEMGQKILDIGEKLPSESANAIFAKYAELVDATREVENFIRKEFSEDIAQNPQVIDQVREKLLQRGVAVLNHFHSKIDHFKENEEAHAVHIINEALSQISADTITTLSTFKFAKKQGFTLSLEDIQNSEFRKRRVEDISETEREEMVKIYRENYADNPELAKKLLHAFNRGFDGHTHRTMSTFKMNGELLAFIAFDDYQDGRLMNALNIKKNAQDFSLGLSMMHSSVLEEAKIHIIYGHAVVGGMTYTNFLEMGFVDIAEVQYPGVQVGEIKLDIHDADKYISKTWTQEDIISMKKQSPNTRIEIYKDLNSFDRSQLDDEVITRFFLDKQNGQWFVVFEKSK